MWERDRVCGRERVYAEYASECMRECMCVCRISSLIHVCMRECIYVRESVCV